METTLHISKIDESVMLALRHKAEERHVSVEELVRGYLREIGTTTWPTVAARESNGNGKQDKNSVLNVKQFGVWSEEDLREFERNTAPMREIDPDLWK